MRRTRRRRRRKFFEAQKFAPACKEVLELIGELYALEADLPGWYALENQTRQTALAHRLAVRQQKSAPLTQRIRDWAHSQRAMPGSAFRKTLEYMLNLWSGMTVFLTQPQVSLDNNHVERQLRDRVIGRKRTTTAASLSGVPRWRRSSSPSSRQRACAVRPRATTCGALRSPPSRTGAPSRSRRASADHCSGLALRPGRLSAGTGHGEHLQDAQQLL